MAFTPSIFVDLKRCIGCNACSLACKQENNVQIGELWNRVYGCEKGAYPSVDVRVLPMFCQQCNDADCKKMCDELGYRAIIKRPDGIYYVDPARCTGCQKCVPACPYKAMFFNTQTRKAEKCHMCMHRIDKGLLPACVITCLGITRQYGDINVLKSQFPGAEDMDSDGSVLYGNMGEEPAHDRATDGFPNPAPFHE